MPLVMWKRVFSLVCGNWILYGENQIHLTGKVGDLKVHFLSFTTPDSCLLKPFIRAHVILWCCEIFYGRCEKFVILTFCFFSLHSSCNKLQGQFLFWFWVCLYACTHVLSLSLSSFFCVCVGVLMQTAHSIYRSRRHRHHPRGGQPASQGTLTHVVAGW